MVSALKPPAISLPAGLEVPREFAHWWPIYFEPMAGSGERITALIAVQPNEGKATLHRTIRPGVAGLLYGRKGEAIIEFLEMVSASVSNHLATHPDLSAWRSPLSGFFAGDQRWGTGYVARDIPQAAIRMVASLGTVDAIASNESDSALAALHWTNSIREEVVSTARALSGNFVRSVNLGTKDNPIRINIGFFSQKYAAQFGVLRPDPQKVLRDQMVLKARMLDLGQLNGTLFEYTENRELIIGRPALDDQRLQFKARRRIQTKIEILEREADIVQVIVRHTDKASQAAAWVCEKAA